MSPSPQSKHQISTQRSPFRRSRRWSTLDLSLAFAWLVLSAISYGGGWWLLTVTHPEFGLWGAAYATLGALTYNGDPAWFARDATYGGWLFACVIAGSVSFIVGAGGLIRVVIVLGRDRKLVVRDHVVILGGGRVGIACLMALEQLSNKDRRTAVREVVFIDRTRPLLPPNMGIRCTTLVGDVSDARLLQRARVDTARFLIAATGDDLENLRAAGTAFELASRQNRHRALPTLVRVGSHHLSRHVTSSQKQGEVAIQRTSGNAADGATKAGPPDHYAYRTAFNVYEIAARHVFAASMHSDQSPAGATEHIVICGFGRFGQAVAREAMRCQETGCGPKIAQIDVVDLDAERLVHEFAFGPESLALDGWIRPHDASILSPEVWGVISGEHGGMHSRVFVCTDADEANLTYAAAIASKAALGEEAGCETTIFVRQPHQATWRLPVDSRVQLVPVVGDDVIGALQQILSEFT